MASTSSAKRAVFSMLSAAAMVVIPAIVAKVVRRRGRDGDHAA